MTTQKKSPRKKASTKKVKAKSPQRDSKGHFISKQKQADLPLVNMEDKPRPARRRIEHTWPKAGTVLLGKYHGQIIRAEVIEDKQQIKPHGKALRSLDDPKLPLGYTMSQAANLFTEKIRKVKNLSTVANGWKFWTTKIQGKMHRLFDLEDYSQEKAG